MKIAYAFVVGLAWCTLRRDTRDLTVSLTQMAKIIEINMVPMEMPPYLTIKISVLCEIHNYFRYYAAFSDAI